MGVPAFLGPWSVAMAAMMLPSELPLFRLDHATSRSALRTTVLGAGYLAVWLAFGAAAVLADRIADGRIMGLHSGRATAIVLAAAALYQVTPLKRRCLAVCRSPLSRMFHGWRDGLPGAFRMGVENGLWCAGCCIGLVAALFALGMMSVWWMVLVGVAIFVEKTTAVGVVASRIAAVALAAGAVVWAL